ncbi:MAG: trehalose-phosphatase [Elusimicrobia bacterium]|nr:trehalose-phosphatase [Elusimicrobiota bacterium]
MSLPSGLRRAVTASAARGEKWLIALDFDGTLARLRRARSAARLPHGRRLMLQRLGRLPGVRVVIVSGRELADLRRRCRIRGAALSGEHGMSLTGFGRAWSHPATARLHRESAALAAAASRLTLGMPGVEIERKRTSVSVHWRKAPAVRRDPEGLGRALSGLLRSGWRLAGGKCVWELRPGLARGKGDAILLAQRRLGPGARVLFIGDDATDEEGFRKLGRAAWTVRVGPGETAARWRVAGPVDVDALLVELSTARRQAGLSSSTSRTRPRSSTRRAPQR